MTDDDTIRSDGGIDDEQVEPNSHPSTAAKVIGTTDAVDDAAIIGHNTATSGVSYGVEGTTDSNELDAAGVYGTADTASGVTYGIRGVTGSTEGQAAGVHGEAPNGTGDANGVHGKSSGSGFGVYGEARGTGVGVRGNTYSSQTGAKAVEGLVGNSGVENYGVAGTSLSTGDGTAGVRGDAQASSGVVYGVKGTTNSADGYGVYSDGDGKTDGNHEVTGSQSVGELGASVYLGSEQSIPSATTKTVTFDTEIADDRGEFDTSTGVFTCSRDGDYHVDCHVRMGDAFYGTETVALSIVVNSSSTVAYGETTAVGDSNEGNQPNVMLSKTLRNLSDGDTIEATVFQDASSSMDVDGGLEYLTYMTISQIG